MTNDSKRYLTIEELAELARVSPNTVRKWRHLNQGPRATKVGGRVIFAQADVDAWLEGQAETTSAG